MGLFETILWLLPALITFDCVTETRVKGTDVERSTEAICTARREFQTAKWIDFWICSTGLQVAGSIFSHFLRHDTRTATDIAQWSISSAMLAAQVVLSSWWIIESGFKSTTGDCIRSKSVKDGFKSTREDVASNRSEEQESSPQRQLVAGRTLSLLELVDTTRETNGRDKSSSSSKLRTPSTATHSNERQHSTTIKSREIDGLVKRVQRNRDIDDASSEYSSSSASSYSRNGSLSDDEESIYSDDSSASKEMSISADMAADGIQSQIPSSSQVEVVVSNTVDEQKASFSPKTPAYVAVKNAIDPPEINTLRIPINIVASDHGGFAGSEVANIPAAPPPATTHPEPPQRASKIIAQLDSLLFDELERLAIFSPADTEVVNSAIRSQPANSPLTPRVAALERKRGMKHGEEKQYLKTGTNEIPHDEVPVSPYIKVSEETHGTFMLERANRLTAFCVLTGPESRTQLVFNSTICW